MPAGSLALFEVGRAEESEILDSLDGLRGGAGDGALEELAFEDSEGVTFRDRELGYDVLPPVARRSGCFSGDGESSVRSI